MFCLRKMTFVLEWWVSYTEKGTTPKAVANEHRKGPKSGYIVTWIMTCFAFSVVLAADDHIFVHLIKLVFSKTTSHVFPAVSKQSYTDNYLVA